MPARAYTPAARFRPIPTGRSNSSQCRDPPSRPITHLADAEFAPGSSGQLGVLAAPRGVGRQAGVPLLQSIATQFLAERGLLRFGGSVVELAVLQPGPLEFRNLEQLDELGAGFRQAEGRGKVRHAHLVIL